MDCPVCGVTMYVVDSKLITRNDDTPEKETVIVRVQTLQCHNPSCRHTERIEHIIESK